LTSYLSWKNKTKEDREKRNNFQKSNPKKTKKYKNPKVNLLVEKIKLRQEQLKKLPKTDINYSSLYNELQAYKRAVNRIQPDVYKV
jgi:hypothetical protein